MNTINGVIVNIDLIEAMLKAGFKHLGSHSPYHSNMGTVVYSRHLSIDEKYIVWQCYLVESNPMIKEVAEGEYEIPPGAKPFAGVSHRDGFINIDAKSKSFNHLAAMKVYLDL